VRLSFIARLVLASALLASAIVAGGCSVLGADESAELVDVTDSIALFHFKVPGDWQRTVETGLIAVSDGDEELDPQQETLDRFWMLVYTSSEPSDTPLAENLTYLVEQRAQLRGWQALETDDPAETTVGGREAAVLTANATDVNGIDFTARYYFVRTVANEVLIIAMAPRDMFDDYVDDIDATVGERWFWSSTAGQTETTPTAE